MKEGKGSEKRTSLYKHPENESLVWEGSGRKPKWLIDFLKSGRNLDDFRVSQVSVKEEGQPAGVEVKLGAGEASGETKEVKTEWKL